MHGDRRHIALTDAALDREIECALAVDPSPEFAARVRMRIASEPVPAALAWRSVTWAICFAGGAVVAALLVFIVAVSRDRPTPADTLLPARTVLPFAAPPPYVASEFRVTPHVASGFGRTSTTSAADPDTLIDARETEALQRLIARVREGRVDLTPMLNASRPDVLNLPPIAKIVIDPLTIEPLAPIDGAEGVRR